MLALGALETAEEFYRKCGYSGQLLIQSEKHGLDDLLSCIPGYPIAFTNILDNSDWMAKERRCRHHRSFCSSY